MYEYQDTMYFTAASETRYRPHQYKDQAYFERAWPNQGRIQNVAHVEGCNIPYTLCMHAHCTCLHSTTPLLQCAHFWLVT